jgi:hypothetical protein
MSPEQFAYWLNGHVELNSDSQPDDVQWEIIKDHLKLVMTKITPQREQQRQYEFPKFPAQTPITTLPFPAPVVSDKTFQQFPMQSPVITC